MAKIVNTQSIELDGFDHALLEVVQKDNTKSHEAMGVLVGLSASAVRRRITRLRDTGVIAKNVSIVDRNVMGITLVVFLKFGTETAEICKNFETQMNALPQVQQCYTVAGENDYILIVHVPSLQFYETWSMETFMSNDAVQTCETTVVWSCKKFDTSVPTGNIASL